MFTYSLNDHFRRDLTLCRFASTTISGTLDHRREHHVLDNGGKQVELLQLVHAEELHADR